MLTETVQELSRAIGSYHTAHMRKLDRPYDRACNRSQASREMETKSSILNAEEILASLPRKVNCTPDRRTMARIFPQRKTWELHLISPIVTQIWALRIFYESCHSITVRDVWDN